MGRLLKFRFARSLIRKGTVRNRPKCGHYAITLPTVFMGYTEMLYKTLERRISPGNVGCLMSIWTDIDPIRQIWQHEAFITFCTANWHG